MAPVKPNNKSKGQFVGRGFKKNYAKGPPAAANKWKRKWVPEHKVFDGSLQEGQGFAFKRKQKVQHEYNKLLRKERRRNQESRQQAKEEYPEHLRHLYVAEEEKQRNAERMNRLKRTLGRSAAPVEEEEVTASDDAPADKTTDATVTTTATSHQTSTTSASTSTEPPQTAKTGSFPKIPLSNRKMKKVSSYQKTKEEYERRREERERKREAFLKDKVQREEALKKYKEKKMATYQLLKKKTKKGQPNLNLQMDLLLQKIQAQRKDQGQ